MTALPAYKIDFIGAAIEADALKFGEFKLKSGRLSPYFFKADCFHTPNLIQTVGNAYAQTIIQNQIECDTVFGPAYKGIPLAVATVQSFATMRGAPEDVSFSSNRKEEKTHGDGGMVVGAMPGKKTVITDDVITSGISIDDSIEFIRKNRGDVCAAVVLVDRKERGISKEDPSQPSEFSAIQEIESKHGIKIHSVIDVDDIWTYAKNDPKLVEYAEKIQAYRAQYGIHLTP